MGRILESMIGPIIFPDTDTPNRVGLAWIDMGMSWIRENSHLGGKGCGIWWLTWIGNKERKGEV